jgi:hypothetical protein
MQTPSELAKPLGANAREEIKQARNDTKKEARTAFKDPEVYNTIVNVPTIKKDVGQLVRNWKRTPDQLVDDPTVKSVISKLKKLQVPTEDLPEGYVGTVKIGDLHNQQVRLGKVLSNAKSGKYTESQGLAASLYGYINDVMDQAPGSEKLFAAKDKWKNYFDTFVYNKEFERQSPLAAALKKSPENVLSYLSKESFNTDVLKKAGVGLDSVEKLKLSEFTNLPTAKDKLKWIETNRPKLSGLPFWNQIEGYVDSLKGITQPTKAVVSPFANISESQVPTKIFGDEKTAAQFMRQFKGTEAEYLARGKWLDLAQKTKGGLPEAYRNQSKIAQTIFGHDVSGVEKVIRDIESAKSVDALKQLATGKQSISGQTATTLGAIFKARSLLKGLQTGALVGPAIGAIAGHGLPGVVVGQLGGLAASKLGKMREDQLQQIVVKMLADPKLIKFATAVPTKKNISSFVDQATHLGYLGAKTANQNEQQLSVETKPTIDLDAAIEAARKRIEQLEASSLKSSPQKLSALINNSADKHGIDPSLIHAVAEQESNFNPEAKGPKTRYGQAKGIMQIMDETAQGLGLKNPYNAAENIDAGAKLLAQLKDQFGDDKLALAAYNWRPAALKNQLKILKIKGIEPTWENLVAYGDVPSQTEEYVPSVLKKRKKYIG